MVAAAGNHRSLDSPARRGLTRDDITKKRRAVTRGWKPRTTRTSTVAVLVRDARRRGVNVLGTQAVEQRLLLAGQEAQLQPAEDVIHDRLGVANVLVMAPAARLEAGVRELFAHQLERHAVL